MATRSPAVPAPIKIRSLKELVDSGLQYVPETYIRPPHERVDTTSLSVPVNGSFPEKLPIISLRQSGNQLRQQIGLACKEWGIFQVIDHGFPTILKTELWEAISHFFSLPTDVKIELVSQGPSSPLFFFSGLYAQDTVSDWKDTLGFRPNRSTNLNLLPSFLREPLLKFEWKMGILAQKLIEMVFSSLRLDENIFSEIHTRRRTMTFNYYPVCPEPNLTYGLSSHSDIGSITILMQDAVKGLQVKREERWIDVEPMKDAFIVLIGDQIEILTNGHYESVEHRVTTNKTVPRMSVACFFAPSEEDVVRPLKEFVDAEHPSLYKETKFCDYLRNGLSKPLSGKTNLKFSSLKLLPA
ncbi:hypothetical protein KP509_26G045300 [Ceratopteris richardii]|uniref:Fe2OG dioxygenase domain-containing protein n=1 Tax=Ceratopteris richardii TaxID=49495 RepID=A0A8T2RKA4_CERRI|nr:hypothetical protein KP509_26G045300 [Ceratopteris richardii]